MFGLSDSSRWLALVFVQDVSCALVCSRTCIWAWAEVRGAGLKGDVTADELRARASVRRELFVRISEEFLKGPMVGAKCGCGKKAKCNESR
ncbi:unnamed protein product [Cochlearia groenlandica]